MRATRWLVTLSLLFVASTANAQFHVLAWGDNGSGQAAVPVIAPSLTFADVAAGYYHSVALLSDGSAIAWGRNDSFQCDVPALAAGLTYVEVAAGHLHTVARVNDGTVRAWGYNGSGSGQCNVPPAPIGVSYVRVSAGQHFTLALRSDGSVVAVGSNSSGQCSVPTPPPGKLFVDVVAGDSHALGLLNDGSLLAWGRNIHGECNVPALPGPLTYVAMSANDTHSIALRSDGEAVAWGLNTFGECDVPPLPLGVTYVQVAAGYDYSLARRSDDVVVAWGLNTSGQCVVPPTPNRRIVDISAGVAHTLARTEERFDQFCFGDGPTNGGPDCPCSNNVAIGVARGCTNSTGNGGKLVATGNASLSADTVTLTGSDMAPASFSLFLQSPTNTGGAPYFFDGLRCVGPSFVRLTTKMSVAGAAAIGSPSTPISILGGIASSGTQYYQVVYRNNAGLCNFLANSTNGVAVVWVP